MLKLTIMLPTGLTRKEEQSQLKGIFNGLSVNVDATDNDGNMYSLPAFKLPTVVTVNGCLHLAKDGILLNVEPAVIRLAELKMLEELPKPQPPKRK